VPPGATDVVPGQERLRCNGSVCQHRGPGEVAAHVFQLGNGDLGWIALRGRHPAMGSGLRVKAVKVGTNTVRLGSPRASRSNLACQVAMSHR
jgi:hypothetical protein